MGLFLSVESQNLILTVFERLSVSKNSDLSLSISNLEVTPSLNVNSSMSLLYKHTMEYEIKGQDIYIKLLNDINLLSTNSKNINIIFDDEKEKLPTKPARPMCLPSG